MRRDRMHGWWLGLHTINVGHGISLVVSAVEQRKQQRTRSLSRTNQPSPTFCSQVKHHE
ncbi:MAG TPA: hypothetical protein VKG92_07855 [Flavobacteriales bacterium]|nr:hypothetical protein [Flavobacteriales bacterium]